MQKALEGCKVCLAVAYSTWLPVLVNHSRGQFSLQAIGLPGSSFMRLHQTRSWDKQEPLRMMNAKVLLGREAIIRCMYGKDSTHMVCSLNGIVQFP